MSGKFYCSIKRLTFSKQFFNYNAYSFPKYDDDDDDDDYNDDDGNDDND